MAPVTNIRYAHRLIPPSQPLIEREKAGVAHTTTLFNIVTLLTLVKSNTGVNISLFY